MSATRRTSWQIFGGPVILAIFSAVGLVGTLLFEDWADILWIIGVAAPIFAIAWHFPRSRPHTRGEAKARLHVSSATKRTYAYSDGNNSSE